ncbi:MAG: proprotein convertase P-domain-containing protein [Planctomycetes bacterium]|nr:proprotein convertase P-domain-containing protein [Planctomycetota bacterium]
MLATAFLASYVRAQPNDLVVEVCGYSNAQFPGAIPDGGPDPVQNLVTIPTTGPILDLDIRLDIDHTWVGDLVIWMTHIETGTSVLLVDRPGAPATSTGCGADNFDIILDDEGQGGLLENQCSATGSGSFPTSPPNYVPTQSLAAFDGENLGGNWLISVNDVRSENSGTLISWCLRANLGPVGIRSTVSAEADAGVDECAESSDELVVVPGTLVRVCYIVENIGELALDTHTLVSSLHGDVLVGAFFDLQPGGEYHVTRLTTINQDTTVTGTWHSRVGVAPAFASDSISILSDTDGDGRSDDFDACPGGDDFLDADNDGTADFCDGCPQDPNKIDAGECGCGVGEGSCGGGNENANNNENTNGNENANENTNTNENANGNDNQNDNTGGNENTNTNTNENGNSNANGNDNSNVNENSNENMNSNGNANENQNQNANENSNTNSNNNGNNNQSSGNENNNSNANVIDNTNGNQNNNESPAPQAIDCFIDCGNGLCGAGANAYLALSLLFVFAARNRRK